MEEASRHIPAGGPPEAIEKGYGCRITATGYPERATLWGHAKLRGGMSEAGTGTLGTEASPSNAAMVCTCKSLQSCPTVCNPMDCSLPGSSVHGILLERILEWVAMTSPRGSSRPRIRTRVSCLLHWQAGPLPLASVTCN